MKLPSTLKYKAPPPDLINKGNFAVKKTKFKKVFKKSISRVIQKISGHWVEKQTAQIENNAMDQINAAI